MNSQLDHIEQINISIPMSDINSMNNHEENIPHSTHTECIRQLKRYEDMINDYKKEMEKLKKEKQESNIRNTVIHNQYEKLEAQNIDQRRIIFQIKQTIAVVEHERDSLNNERDSLNSKVKSLILELQKKTSQIEFMKHSLIRSKYTHRDQNEMVIRNGSVNSSSFEQSYEVELPFEEMPIKSFKKITKSFMYELHKKKDEIDVIKDIVQAENNPERNNITSTNHETQIDEWVLEQKPPTLNIKHKKKSFNAKVTKQGILFTKTSPNKQWNIFLVYESLSKDKEHKFSFKAHQVKTKDFVIGLGLKQQLKNYHDFSKQNILVYKPYDGKFRGNNNELKRGEILSLEKPCQFKINFTQGKVYWQQNDEKCLFSFQLTPRMLQGKLVVFISLLHPMNQVEMIVL